MKYVIFGAGNVGTAITRGVTAAGHDVTVVDPDQEALDNLTGQVGSAQTARAGAEVVADADVVVLAVNHPIGEEVVSGLADTLAGKIVIDTTNPMAEDLSGNVTDGGPSAAERVQAAAPDARVVKAFNTVFASNQAVAEVDGVQLDGFLAGDDAEAKQVVAALLEAIGFRPIDVGGLSNSRYLEGMALLNIAMNAFNELPWQSGWKLVGPVA